MIDKNTILQLQNRKFIENTLGTEPWTQVSGHEDLNRADAGFWCGLVSLDRIDEVYSSTSWDINYTEQSVPGFIGFSDGAEYKSNTLSQGFESIIYYRDFLGVKPDYCEISQEFILLNNLYHDTNSNKYYAMYESGEDEEAVKIVDGTKVYIKTKFLKKFACAKQMALLLYFDIRVEFNGQLTDYGIDKIEDRQASKEVFYDVWGGDFPAQNKCYSIMMGKKVFMPDMIENCGYWPNEKKKIYEEFTIGADEYGDEVKFTCDPKQLSNYFGANPGAPHYLTPVFFKREVLQKYFLKPELYEIRDGYLGCKSLWGIELDNHHDNCIAVYLGDLGTYLPENEQAYWKSFNILGEEKLSEVSRNRDFLNVPTESNMADHRFMQLYSKLTEQWEKKYAWRLFLPLAEKDKYNFTQIRIPLSNSQPEFDQLVLSLVKVLIDSLNEKKLQIDDGEESAKGISKLEKWLKANSDASFEQHIQFLRNLQELRSAGTGHRKGKNYDKITAKFGLLDSNHQKAFESILMQANQFLLYLMEQFIEN